MLFVISSGSLSYGQDFQDFSVLEFKSGAMIKMAGKGEWSSPDLSKPYPTGSSAKTSSAGPMKLQFDPQNIFRLLPGAEVIVKSPRDEGRFRRVTIDLKSGQVNLTLDNVPKNHVIEVQTPTAVCGAVGTTFSVNYSSKGSGLNQKFSCSRGQIFAKSSRDQSFQVNGITAGKSVSAQVLPGKQNSANRLQLPSGVNVNLANQSNSSYAFSSSGATVDVAKDINSTSQALVVVRSGKVGDMGTGSYLLNGGNTSPVPAAKASTASEYWNLASQEGQLKARIDSGEKGLEAQLGKIASAASKKRQELFDRALIRDTVRDSLPGGRR